MKIRPPHCASLLAPLFSFTCIWQCTGAQLLANYKCGCLDYELTEGEDYKDIIPHVQFFEHYMGGFSETVQRHVVEILCHGVVNLGDMLQVGWASYYYSFLGP